MNISDCHHEIIRCLEMAGSEEALRMFKTGNVVLMPGSLTAENGAKGELSGEFHETISNPLHCECGEADCEMCEDAMHHQTETVEVPVSWTTVKQIYNRAVEMFIPT